MQLSMTAILSSDDICAAVAQFVAAETNRPVDPSQVTLTDNGATVTVGAAEEPAKKATKARKTRKAAETPEPETSEDDNPETSAESDAEVEDTQPEEVTETVADEKTEEAAQEEQAKPATKKAAAGSIFSRA